MAVKRALRMQFLGIVFRVGGTSWKMWDWPLFTQIVTATLKSMKPLFPSKILRSFVIKKEEKSSKVLVYNLPIVKRSHKK